jgi:antirestriction protein ArdC
MEPHKPRRDLYAEVTHCIVAALAQGVRPWACPWKTHPDTNARPMRHNGEPYRGVAADNYLERSATTILSG